MAIAEGTPGDLSDLVRMMAAFARGEGDPDHNFTIERAAEDLFGPRPWVSSLVARRGGEPAGALLWHWAYETPYASRGAYIASLWVEPGHRRHGVATALVAALADRVQREGGAHLWWASKPGNKTAHATYESLGAFAEGVMAHALFGPSFEALAEGYRAHGRARPR
ncbi:MAG: GNAT family N-acetyltransferase [Bauldia sp.]|nr:GNAT family N-acetyltransferase [Bauldia sp.]